MPNAHPVPLLRRLGIDRHRQHLPDAGDYGTDVGMEIYLSQRSLADQRSLPAARTVSSGWWRRLARRMRLV